MIIILKHFWHYQWERFPILVLLCTTSAVVLSSAGVQQVSLIDRPFVFAGTVILIILLIIIISSIKFILLIIIFKFLKCIRLIKISFPFTFRSISII